MTVGRDSNLIVEFSRVPLNCRTPMPHLQSTVDYAFKAESKT